ncbi:MAG: hypothetical protein K2H44_07600 [Muribaculaceae bacterium]|nr:hypothetical protein [Muribaculaceae bacterium]
MLKLKHALSFAFVVGLTCSTAMAQDYYDDDIYYNPAKVKTEKVEQKKTTKSTKKYNSNVAIYQPSDSFVFNSGSTRNIDEYNRRNQTAAGQHSSNDQVEDFAYTRQIERFYNPEVVSSSKDADLQEYYYYSQTEKPQTTVNIYLEPNYRWWSPSWYYGWNNPWSWNWGWGYDPWLDPWYAGPSWSWNWGWGPSWSWNWGWGPSWNWGWGPAWYPSYRPSWGWAHTPVYRPSVGAMGTHRPAMSTRYSSSTRRPSQTVSGTTNRRPTNSSTSLSGQRPGANRNQSTTNYNTNNSSWSSGQRGGSYNSGSSGSYRSSGSGGGHSTSGRRR